MGDWVDFDLPIGGHDSPVPRDQAQIDYARRAYYAQLTCIDHHLNRMIMGLFENEALDNTAILFFADHGEMLYAHNCVAKGMPFDGSARIPFLLRLPKTGKFSGYAKGDTVDNLVEIRDILPTLCDLAGVAVPETVDGRSILGLCRGEADGWRTDLHGEHVLSPDRSNQWLTDGQEKYIWLTQSGRELLFDIESDPDEMHDLSRERPERIAYWRGRLIEELAGREEGFVQDGDLVVGRPQSPTLVNVGHYQQR
jgi:arylsulfatase A-like enzyme